MHPLAELDAARLCYRAAVSRALVSLRRHEEEYKDLCDLVERCARIALTNGHKQARGRSRNADH